jgi:hypothetical protein
MTEIARQIPTPDELAAEVRDIEENRLTLGKLLQFLPGGPVRADMGRLAQVDGESLGIDFYGERAAEIVSDVDRAIEANGLDAETLEEWQAALNDHDPNVHLGAKALLSEVLSRTVYVDLRSVGYEKDVLTDNVPDKSAEESAAS